MKSVFTGAAPGTRLILTPPIVREIILEALMKDEWMSTSMIHKACYGDARRAVLHNVLKEMLESREIQMRVISPGSAGGRPRTEFKRISD